VEDFVILSKINSGRTLHQLFLDRDRGQGERTGIMHEQEYRAAVAAFIAARGVTRCPTACALPTQGTVTPADRAALETYAADRTRLRHKRQVARDRLLLSGLVSAHE